MTDQDNYGFIGPIPSGVTIADNVARMQAFQKTHTPEEIVQWVFESCCQ